MDILVLVLLCLCAASSTAYKPDGTKCEPEKGAPTCVCNYKHHGTMNLTKLANMDGTPRFTGLKGPRGYEYDYNPCSSFKVSGACTDVQVCQRSPVNITYAIADYGTEQMWLGDDGIPYLYYTNHDRRVETFVYLNCDPSAKEPIVTAKGDTEVAFRYVFTVVSQHACFANGPGKCNPVPGAESCVCQHPDGIIDLTKIANTDGTPRYRGLMSRSESSSVTYDYNPCAPFTGAYNCTNVQGCQSISYGNGSDYNDIADYHTEQIWIRENGTTYIHYTGPNQRELNVSLFCDQSVKDAIVAVTGDGGLNYDFNLISCYACPGGCKSKHWQLKIN